MNRLLLLFLLIQVSTSFGCSSLPIFIDKQIIEKKGNPFISNNFIQENPQKGEYSLYRFNTPIIFQSTYYLEILDKSNTETVIKIIDPFLSHMNKMKFLYFYCSDLFYECHFDQNMNLVEVFIANSNGYKDKIEKIGDSLLFHDNSELVYSENDFNVSVHAGLYISNLKIIKNDNNFTAYYINPGLLGKLIKIINFNENEYLEFVKLDKDSKSKFGKGKTILELYETGKK